ncbi:hypothetical protein TVAG_545260 [Trichomonas vaginalis G3]|uniref:Uncharacterized protein n=1 Tax=Trichomonas vaginalis (strain ATCC PRA-98 / G3) TaxID=412133 RepID=A2GKJ7_TRIV3|nr:hypothetical protein TVAGG3_0917460 [Trichomonas vaginalis G3]EAX82320.1 hypothetical protein TVAG_545260 [Trichomonas vaginalis G3]KAI5484910.1 hypothetical protein TVAGG3_0917460 [Trichomonas vaginalis G3]|eukprot:XP_001295250.1 hypothetical protein [Trichomonas vaginalis G3]
MSSVVGLLGAVIVVGIWWSNIRYDFPFWQNDNDEAYNLYIVVLCGWIFPIISFIAATLNRFLVKCKLNFLASLFMTLSLLAGIGEVVDLIMVIVMSEPKYCKIIQEKTTYPGNETEKYKKWYEGKTKKMNPGQIAKFDSNLRNYRCDTPNLYVTIFLSVCAGAIMLSFIIVITAKRCAERNNPELESVSDNTRFLLSQA